MTAGLRNQKKNYQEDFEGNKKWKDLNFCWNSVLTKIQKECVRCGKVATRDPTLVRVPGPMNFYANVYI